MGYLLVVKYYPQKNELIFYITSAC